MNQLNINLNENEVKYITIYKAIKNAIIQGKIKYDEKLPSKRTFAKFLNVSINTIINAYDLLVEEEYILSKEKKGYFVIYQKYNLTQQKNLKLNEEVINWKYDFSGENVDSTIFPYYTLKKISSDVISNSPSIWLTKAPRQGNINLRNSIGNYLFQTKGMDVNSSNIIIVNSLEDGLEIISHLIDITSVALEEYSYLKVTKYFQKSQKKIIFCNTDSDGIVISHDHVDLAYVIPFNQFPLSIKMSLKRKTQILSSNVKYILEDDFDCDLISNQKMETSLYSLDNTKVFYYGSFSHTLCPGLRISYLVIPPHLVDLYQKEYGNSFSNISNLDQSILDKFLSEGHYFRHLHQLRKVNQEKKKKIINYLETIDYIKYQTNKLSFFVNILKPFDDKRLKEDLLHNQVKVKFLEDFSLNQQNKTIIISYYSLSLEQIDDSLDFLFNIINNSLL